MIYIKQPAMAINSFNVPPPYYTMADTYVLPPVSTAAMVVELIRHAAKKYTLGRLSVLRNVVINCHGSPGALWVGGPANPITEADVPLFSALGTSSSLPSLQTLWIVACKPASGAKGKAFCAALAKACGCRVVASEDTQWVSGSDRIQMKLIEASHAFTGPRYVGAIDDYEGVVWQFDQTGIMTPVPPGSYANMLT
jgi:hypothetical protein